MVFWKNILFIRPNFCQVSNKFTWDPFNEKEKETLGNV